MVSEKTLEKWVNSLPTEQFIAARKLSRDWQEWFYNMRNISDDGKEPLDNMPSLVVSKEANQK